MTEEEFTEQELQEMQNYIKCKESCVDEFSDCEKRQRSGKCVLGAKKDE